MLTRILAAACVPALVGCFLLWFRLSWWRFQAGLNRIDAAFWEGQSGEWRKVAAESAVKVLEGEQAKSKLAGYLAADLERQLETERKLVQAEREIEAWRKIHVGEAAK